MSTRLNKPRFAAQMENMPLAVTSGINGFRLTYVYGAASMVIRDQNEAEARPLEFADPNEAYRVMREAQGATAAALAGIQVGPRR